MAEILDSREICGSIEKTIKEEIVYLPKLCLASISVGEDFSANVYQLSQEKVAETLGIKYLSINLAADISFDEFKEEIDKLNSDTGVTGIILNKPFFPLWKDVEVFSLIDVKKDVEGMHPINLGKFFIGNNQLGCSVDSMGVSTVGVVSPTVCSVVSLIKITKVSLRGKKVTIIGFSSLIGKPLALFLGDELATVSITHIATYQAGNLEDYVKGADIVISAVGKPHLIKGEWIKKGAVVIDVGTGEKNGKLTGDVEFSKARENASYITPVPGGIGRLTTMCLFHNLVVIAKNIL
ncbi:MAG: bifunctional 5,10-methylenetetrahydrofolate dehydrogenase/5,10-methenyltetrahydrofolate cyclohydrolase [Candidatus Omnitrophota bacterium]|nr:bifunctional 5,10-methylenetetrahydrofolate dehydrogenase/5,10-methenyltetrahydrofolate cyclohydrolase [Candidatus Omnitrophota bacterium]